MATSPSMLFLLSLVLLFNALAEAKVPTSQTFTYINQGDIGFMYEVEYNAQYRLLPINTTTFQLCFYTTSSDAFYLALRMGNDNSESRWVWEANRGRPVRENATLTFGPDGNLVLTNPDRRVVWSTGTANKGVVGIKLLPTGNLVLYDDRGRFIWQSFDYPTDTLLVGQTLHATSKPHKLVSRASAVDGSFGIYSFAMESKGVAMYVNYNRTAAIPYYKYSTYGGAGPEELQFNSQLHPTGLYELMWTVPIGYVILARPRYNATLSYMRLEIDGSVSVYTYYENADYSPWEKTFTLFSSGMASACALPGKCGALGVCEDEMCTACPTPEGLRGWNKGCQSPKLGVCGMGKAAAVSGYYKVVGVESFLSRNVQGASGVKVEECKRRCSADCGCKGIMYTEESSTCWLAPILGTLSKVAESSHVAYIKYTSK